MTDADLRMRSLLDQQQLCDLGQSNALECIDICALLSSFYSSEIILNNQLISFLSNINVPAGIKDLNSRHIFCNKRYLSLGGIPQNYMYQGKSDGPASLSVRWCGNTSSDSSAERLDNMTDVKWVVRGTSLM